MLHHGKSLRVVLALTLVWQSTHTGAAEGGEILGRLKRLGRESTYHGTPPATGHDGSMELLAENIDWLEHHIDTYGSIVAKQPDIWGEARLTKHRDEYERILYRELNQFSANINASIRQSDVSFFAQALALSAAAGQTAPPALPTLANPAALTASVANIEGGNTIGLEPVTVLDQMSRYVNHLHQLRRGNEGDDTSDSPGYALNLVRMPVSLLPGKLTREGFGGEITVTAEPVLTDDLLPTTFRNLVINDVIDQLGLTLVRTVEREDEFETIDRLEEAFGLLNEAAQVTLEQSGSKQSGPAEQARLKALVSRLYANELAHGALIAIARGVTDTLEDIFARNFRESNSAEKEYLIKYLPYAIEALSSKKIGLRGGITSLDELERKVGLLGLFVKLLEIQKSLAEKNCKDVQRIAKIKIAAVIQGAGRDLSLDKSQIDIIYGIAALSALSVEVSSGQFQNFSDQLHCLFDSVIKKDAAGTLGAIGALQEMRGVLETEIRLDEGTNPRTAKSGSEKLPEPSGVITKLGDVQKFVKRDSPELSRRIGELIERLYQDETGPTPEIASLKSILESLRAALGPAADALLTVQRQEVAKAVAVSPSGRLRRATNPINPSFLVPIAGLENLRTTAQAFNGAYSGRLVRWAGFKDCKSRVGKDQECRVDLLDMRRWLQSETTAAYELLSRPEYVTLWYEFARPGSGLADAIRTGDLTSNNGRVYGVDAVVVESARRDFFRAIHCGLPAHPESWGEQPGATKDDERAANSIEALAWAVVVESALLNQRLNADLRKVAVAKQEQCIMPGRELSFFLPDAVAAPGFYDGQLTSEFEQATATFQQYVRVRFPIHVFALDPAAQDQNVADASSRRRELQFALALGFSTGKIGGNSLTQFSRDLQTDLETISLNRTIVGFGHGSDTFGWRFQPRVQSLPVPGTFGALRETLLGTSRDYDLRHRQIEPGMRECVAIVLMPSFVPYVDFHIRSNWMKLTNPKNAALTMKDTLHLSRAITRMRNCRAQCVRCEHLYRPMELQRMLKRVHQLDQELPLQSTRVQVPYENTLGGFEMFNTGVTDLAPELIGWYGAPGVVVGEPYSCSATAAASTSSPSSPSTLSSSGLPACTSGCTTVATTVNGSTAPAATPAAGGSAGGSTAKSQPLPICEGNGTTLFLVGNNFSVHDTKVIAGGVCIDTVRLVSRDIMRVTIPSCVNSVNVDGKDYVAVYAATPYGVTNHLHIPVHTRSVAKDSKSAIDKAVEAEVKKQIAAAKLAPSPVVFTPQGDKKIELEAFCDLNSPSNLKLNVTSAPVIECSATIPPQSKFDRSVYVSIYKGDKRLILKDWKPKIDLTGGTSVISSGEIQALMNRLRGDLAAELSYADLADDGKETLSMVLSIQLAGDDNTALAVPVAAAIEIEVSLAVPCGADAPAAAKGTEGGEGSGSRTPACPGCGTVRDGHAPRPRVTPAAWGPVTTAPRPLPGVRVPARFVQQPGGAEVLPAPSPVSNATATDNAAFSDFSARLGRIEAALQAMQQAAATQQPAATVAAPQPPTSTVEVRVVAPPATEPTHTRLWDPDDHPVVTQTKIRLGERWRNVRDNLPRQ